MAASFAGIALFAAEICATGVAGNATGAGGTAAITGAAGAAAPGTAVIPSFCCRSAIVGFGTGAGCAGAAAGCGASACTSSVGSPGTLAGTSPNTGSVRTGGASAILSDKDLYTAFPPARAAPPRPAAAAGSIQSGMAKASSRIFLSAARR